MHTQRGGYKLVPIVCVVFWLATVVFYITTSKPAGAWKGNPESPDEQVELNINQQHQELTPKLPPKQQAKMPANQADDVQQQRKRLPKHLPFRLVDKNVSAYGFPSAFQGQPPTDKIVSKMANQADMNTAWVSAGLENVQLLPNIWHRKQWELSYIQVVLNSFGKLKAGNKALVFAVGQEPLVAYFAKLGISIRATDGLNAVGWESSGQWSSSVKALLKPWINMSFEDFSKLVTFEAVDMNKIPEHLLKGEFDFVWTTCSVEHVGSITLGQNFLLNSMKALKPGGVAVHTTEFNVMNLQTTTESGWTVLWRKKDVEQVRDQLCAAGYRVMPLHFGLGEGYFDVHPDPPPYKPSMVNGDGDPNHLKMHISPFISTSYAIVIQVPESPVSNPCETDIDVNVNEDLP